MAQTYEDIVHGWYTRLRPEFLRRLTAKYSGLSLSEAENIYQKTFLAVHENLNLGRIKEDTSSLDGYIMTIGMRLAHKAWNEMSKIDSIDEGFNNDDGEMASVSKTARKAQKLLRTLPDGDDETPLCKNEVALSLLGDELSHTPEPCGSIIRLFYYENMSMNEIAAEVGYRNASTAKAKKSQCMTDLIKRVTTALQRTGFDITPKKRNHNGKN